MRYRIDMDHPLTVAAGRRMRAVQPQKLLGWIFGGMGLLFLILGIVFLLLGWEQLPQVFTAEVWVGETPDSLAFPMLGLVFTGIGAVFTALGGGFLIAFRRHRRLREELEQYGTRVTGSVTDIRVERAYEVNGRHPLRIYVTARPPFTNEETTLRSALVWDTALSIGDPADVLFDPMNEKNHMVVLEEA